MAELDRVLRVLFWRSAGWWRASRYRCWESVPWMNGPHGAGAGSDAGVAETQLLEELQAVPLHTRCKGADNGNVFSVPAG
jgi:hypothetical protein